MKTAYLVITIHHYEEDKDASTSVSPIIPTFESARTYLKDAVASSKIDGVLSGTNGFDETEWKITLHDYYYEAVNKKEPKRWIFFYITETVIPTM